MIKQYRLLLLALLLIGCKKEPAIELEDFNLDSKVSTFVSDKNKYKTYTNYYQIKSEVIGADTVSDGEFIGSEQPIRIDYKQQMFSYEDVIARFGDFEFNAINFATTITGQLMVFNGVAGKISLEETQDFVQLLNDKYGKAAKTKGEFIKPFDIYTWQLKDRIIKYCVVSEEESNTLKVIADKDHQTIKEGKKETYLKAYIYIIKKHYADQVIGKMSSGDLLYCD
ncbi:hypothetical protein SAMN04487898_103153 [Pedobacter sp. ok626]|uniref:hypothetical protein n=1 Tax=Pedobacter sp. ok626 TaxID=1761882 RepID=UPI00088142F0|nr:hypothetical protein [Pedobacter sp. ok626]SDJ52253.1 hypothetical protein SAMN04487898_103153 [Pedobacter sp. ok626]